MRNIFFDLVFLAGLVSLAYGLYLISLSLSLIVMGLVVCGLVLMIEIGNKGKIQRKGK